MDKYPNLIEDIKKAPKILINERGRYLFHAFSIGERGTRLPYALVDEVLKGLLEKIGHHGHAFDYIVSVVPAGAQWGLLIAHELEKPLTMVIDHSTGFPNENRVHQISPVYDRDLFFAGFEAGDKVIVLDDVISTGATMNIVVDTLKKRYNVKIVGIFCIITKVMHTNKLESQFRCIV